MYPYLYTQFSGKNNMSMSKQELVDALKEASRAGYFGGMGGGGGMSGGGSGGGGGGGSSGAGQFGKELGAAGDAVKGLGNAALGVGSKIAEGGAKLGDVTEALSAGFSGLGTSGSVLGASLDKGAKALNSLGQNIDQNIGTWRKLSDTGLSFGNDIMAMKDQASAARMSIAEMSEVMQKNNSSMLGFGATSAEGAKKFSKMADTFFTSGLGEQLRGMGYTTKELNDVLAVSISGSKLKDLKDKDGQDRSLKAAASLATEMDAVAKITGQSKQEQLDELRRKATDGQRMAAIDEAIAKGGAGAKEAFDAISANGKLMGPQFQKLAEDMASMGRPSEGMEAAYGLLSSDAKKLMSEAGEAARSGDRERAAMLTKQAAAEQAAFQNTSQYRTMAAQAGIKETQESYAQGAKFRNALADAGGNIKNVEASMKKLDDQVKSEQQAGGKDDPNATAGAGITRFAVDLESRGRDLTKVLNDQVIQPLAKDIAPSIVKMSKDLKLGSPTAVADQIGKPMAAGYDKARLDRIVKEEAGDKSGPNKGVGDKDAASKDVVEFHKLITGNQKQSDTALKVIEKIANEKSMSKEDVVKGAMANKGAGMADLVSQIKKELPADAQLDKTDSDKSKKDKITHVSGDKAKPAGESLGAMVEFAGGLFRGTPGKVEIVNGGGAAPVPKRESGSLDKAGKMFEDWGKGTMVELHGMESVMRPQDVSKVIESAMAGVRKTMPKIDIAGASAKLEMPKLEMPKLEMPKLDTAMGKDKEFAALAAEISKMGKADMSKLDLSSMTKLEMPKLDTAMGKDKEFAALAAEISKMGKADMSKLDLSSMTKSISTSISSVSGGGSTTTKQVQSEDSKAAEKELASVREQMQAERMALREKLKAQIGDGSKLGGNAVAKEMRVGEEGKGIAEKYKAIMEPLQKQIDAGISFETTKKAAAIEETTKMVSEQVAITKTSNSKLTDLWEDGSKDKLSTAKKDSESLASMYKDDSKSKLDLAKKTNADAFKEAELAKSVIGTSVKGMSDDMIEAMIPKGAKIEDYYIDMNDKIQSNSADFVANMEKNAKASTSVIETYSTTISSSSKKMAGDIAGALPGASAKPAAAPMPMSMASMSVGMDRAMLKTDDQKKVFDEIMTLNAKASKEKQVSLQEEMMAATATNRAASEAIDLMEEKLDKEGKGFKDLTGKQKEEYDALRKQQNDSSEAAEKAREAINAVDRAEQAKQTLQKMGYDIAVKQEEDKVKIVEDNSEKIKADIADALPVKDVAAKQEEFKSQFTESQQKIIDDYKGYSEENRSFHAQAMESGIKEDTKTAEIIAARISKMKADIGDRQATEEETAELANQEANKKLFERRVEEKKEMLDVMQNLGEYGAKRELELKQKAANEAIAIENKKTDAIKSDISNALPVDTEFGDLEGAMKRQAPEQQYKDTEFGDLDGAIAKNKADDAKKSKMMSVSDMMGGGLDIGPNGMPIMKKIDTAKNSIPAKPADAEAAREDAKFKRQAEEKKAEAAKAAEKKPDAKTATKESTLSDVVAALNTLNKQMGQLIAVSEDGHKSTTKAAKSGASNIYAR
jgi:hypothetical protein